MNEQKCSQCLEEAFLITHPFNDDEVVCEPCNDALIEGDEQDILFEDF